MIFTSLVEGGTLVPTYELYPCSMGLSTRLLMSILPATNPRCSPPKGPALPTLQPMVCNKGGWTGQRRPKENDGLPKIHGAIREAKRQILERVFSFLQQKKNNTSSFMNPKAAREIGDKIVPQWADLQVVLLTALLLLVASLSSIPSVCHALSILPWPGS